jgi:hypothetical protein
LKYVVHVLEVRGVTVKPKDKVDIMDQLPIVHDIVEANGTLGPAVEE